MSDLFPPFAPDPNEPRKRLFKPVPVRVIIPNIITLIEEKGDDSPRYGLFGHLGEWEKSTRVLVRAWLTLGVATFVGAWVFGLFLATLTRFGLESTQAFTTLGHPGFKHFLRLRVRKDGSAIDGWCIGLVDPLREGEKPVLVDQFTWRPPTRKRSS